VPAPADRPNPAAAPILDRLPEPEAVRNRLQCLFAEVRLLRRILPVAEAAAQHRARLAAQG
jgi:hypothetical protein